MTNKPEPLDRIESLRIPLYDATSPRDWKDWYHFVLLQKSRHIRVLVNISLMGRPGHGQIQLTILVTLPESIKTANRKAKLKLATYGNIFVEEWLPDKVINKPVMVNGEKMKLRIEGRHWEIEAEDKISQIKLQLKGEPQAEPLLVVESAPFGSGFIGWGLVPGIRVTGKLSVCDTSFVINKNWFCYHDHNFGRFLWGEDIGWEWLVAYAVDDKNRKYTIILDKRTNKAHTHDGLPFIFVYAGEKLRKVFLGTSIGIRWEWDQTPRLSPRLPGAMATLFSRQTKVLPKSLVIEAEDEQDSLQLKLNVESPIELIVPDNQIRLYTFMQELTGNFSMTAKLDQQTIIVTGLFYAEYVH